jgi:putative transposase
MKIKKAESYHSASHCKYLTQYHIVWCPKFRYSVLKNGIDNTLKEILFKICENYHYKIKALEVMPDHIHIFVDCPQTVAPCDIARTLKSISAIELFKVYPKLKQFYARCGRLWSDGYFISTVGHISETTVKKYIEEQKNEEESKHRNSSV